MVYIGKFDIDIENLNIDVKNNNFSHRCMSSKKTRINTGTVDGAQWLQPFNIDDDILYFNIYIDIENINHCHVTSQESWAGSTRVLGSTCNGDVIRQCLKISYLGQ